MAPTPLPLESVQGVTGYLPSGQEGGAHQAISLSILIDFIIQRTYHDLTVLAELLPRKTDMERKTEIYNFAARTRQLFIRLIALVKWANSVSKVDKSSNIMTFLDKQNLLFIETADMLARMSRETLVRARLPNFHIPAAVEILTTGNYNRLPTCIRERIVPPEQITLLEKKQTLMRLNQVIQHRLVTNDLLPQLRKYKIRNGRVKFEVKNEFSVSLTVMGDNPNLPWRLLDIEILIDDKEAGEGQPLVHSQQVKYMQMLIQARLAESPNALTEVYTCLHYFCQSLQLEVLYTQTLCLLRDRFPEYLSLDDYVPADKLLLSYWHEYGNRIKSELGFRLILQCERIQPGRPLTVVHIPAMDPKEETEIAERAIRSEVLSMELLFVHTIYTRSVSRLSDLKLQFQSFLRDVDLNLQGTPAILTVPVLSPCLRAEQIHITVDTYTGLFRCHVPKHLECPVSDDMEDNLNGDRSKLPELVTQMRFWITHRRCEKTLQHLPATAVEVMPFLTLPNTELFKPGRHKVFVKLHRHPSVILIVHLSENATMPNEIEYTFHLGLIAYQKDVSDNVEDCNKQFITITQPVNSDVPRFYTKLVDVIEFDTFVATHGPGTDVEDLSPHKRKSTGELWSPPSKIQKTIYPAYFIPELAHVVAMCDEKIPFLNLAQALTMHNIPHSGLQVESNATSLVLKILALPMPGQDQQQKQQSPPSEQRQSSNIKLPDIDPIVWMDLVKRILSISIRSQMNKNNQVRIWVVEFVFYSTPLQSTHQKEQGNRRTVQLTYEQANNDFSKTVEDLLNDWSKIVYLYNLVYDFADNLKNKRLSLSEMLVVKSYSYINLLLGYGPKKEVTCNIYWSVQSQGFRLIFVGGISAVNAHSMMRDPLAQQLNQQHCLTQIAYILHETYNPLSSLSKLPIIPILGVPRPQVPVLAFCIIPQSPCLIRLVYQAVYCLEVRFRVNRRVSIRDGSCSRFDRNIIDEFTPIQGLKAFLSKYVDENATFRGHSDDENPPSPMGMEENFGGPSSVTGAGAGGSSPFLSSGMRGPQSPRDSGLRFPAPHTPPSSSNPHTPASPHPSVGGGNSGAQGHGNFNLTSPPGPLIPHPSPGGLMPSSPLNPQPSPHMVHSPGPNAMYMQGHQDSPFTAMSPANTNWPGSPSMPRPSPRPGQSPDHKSTSGQSGGTNPGSASSSMTRLSFNRSWSGALATTLSHEALETICRPSLHPNKDINVTDMSPLERFLGCVYMRRQLHRNIQNEDSLTMLNTAEPGVILFKVDGLQCQVILNQIHMQSLHLKVSQLPPPPTPDGKPPFQLSSDDLLVIEQYFDTRVAAPPYRPTALQSICRLLNLPPQVLKDFVQIMRLEMKPELGGDQLKWTVQMCMRMPPSSLPIVPIGNAGIVIGRMKVLFFLHITRIPYNGKDWKDSPSVVVPLVYDINTNLTQMPERREQAQLPMIIAVGTLLRRFTEYGLQHGQCSLFPAVTELLTNLQIPSELPPPPNQGICAPVGVVGSSPNPMMPMQQMPQVSSAQVGGYPQMGPNPGGPQ